MTTITPVFEFADIQTVIKTAEPWQQLVRPLQTIEEAQSKPRNRRYGLVDCYYLRGGGGVVELRIVMTWFRRRYKPAGRGGGTRRSAWSYAHPLFSGGAWTPTFTFQFCL